MFEFCSKPSKYSLHCTASNPLQTAVIQHGRLIMQWARKVGHCLARCVTFDPWFQYVRQRRHYHMLYVDVWQYADDLVNGCTRGSRGSFHKGDEVAIRCDKCAIEGWRRSWPFHKRFDITSSGDNTPTSPKITSPGPEQAKRGRSGGEGTSHDIIYFKYVACIWFLDVGDLNANDFGSISL